MARPLSPALPRPASHQPPGRTQLVLIDDGNDRPGCRENFDYHCYTRACKVRVCVGLELSERGMARVRSSSRCTCTQAGVPGHQCVPLHATTAGRQDSTVQLPHALQGTG